VEPSARPSADSAADSQAATIVGADDEE
jgi:hypothetical protein